MRQLLLLWAAWIFSASAVLYDRKRDFDDLLKDEGVLAVYYASTKTMCSSYCLARQCHSFFHNDLTYECHILNETFSTNAGSNSDPGSKYFTISEGNDLSSNAPSGSCSAAAESDGFTYDADSGLCFKIHDTTADWNQAKSQCDGAGYRLIVLDNEVKAGFMANLLNTDSSHTQDGYWMGLSYAQGWEDGSSLVYPNWGDELQVLDTGKCALHFRIYSYQWKSEHCNSSRGFICEAF
ncbi:snaclec agkisacutacin subunit A-like [Haliotis rufescens]|uniref:snaclec agkisacutacin subunit A-like n=1 Tax=Haliotis rufescens TaxID=6454 RepID=UPI00201E9608|nr:snaclec agkisacutacin subunit A-like [Haliotis rufescens]